MDLKSLSIEALKAKIYDSLVVVENHQQFIKILNNELGLRNSKPAETQAQEVVNKIIEEKTDEETK